MPFGIPVLAHWLGRRVARESWDRLLWVSGCVALAGILVTSYSPALSELAVLFSLSLLVNGPYSPLLPVAHEPILMVFGRLYHPLIVAAVATTASVMAEYVNYRLYAAALSLRALDRLREGPTGRRVSAWFAMQPFWTVAICALTPIPFWIGRTLAALTGYSPRRFLVAVAVGRLPRQWFYAAFGLVLPLSNLAILVIGGVSTVLLVLPLLLRGRQAEAEPEPAAGEAA